MAAEQNFLHNVHNVFALLRIHTSNMDEEHSRQVVLWWAPQRKKGVYFLKLKWRSEAQKQPRLHREGRQRSVVKHFSF